MKMTLRASCYANKAFMMPRTTRMDGLSWCIKQSRRARRPNMTQDKRVNHYGRNDTTLKSYKPSGSAIHKCLNPCINKTHNRAPD